MRNTLILARRHEALRDGRRENPGFVFARRSGVFRKDQDRAGSSCGAMQGRAAGSVFGCVWGGDGRGAGIWKCSGRTAWLPSLLVTRSRARRLPWAAFRPCKGTRPLRFGLATGMTRRIARLPLALEPMPRSHFTRTKAHQWPCPGPSRSVTPPRQILPRRAASLLFAPAPLPPPYPDPCPSPRTRPSFREIFLAARRRER